MDYLMNQLSGIPHDALFSFLAEYPPIHFPLMQSILQNFHVQNNFNNVFEFNNNFIASSAPMMQSQNEHIKEVIEEQIRTKPKENAITTQLELNFENENKNKCVYSI